VYVPGSGSVVPPKAAATTIMASSVSGGSGGKLGNGGGVRMSPWAFTPANRIVEASITKRQNVEYFKSLDKMFHLQIFLRLFKVSDKSLFLAYLNYSIEGFFY